MKLLSFVCLLGIAGLAAAGGYPDPEPEDLPTALEVIRDSPIHTILEATIDQLGLDDLLDDDFAGTLLAPTDAALTAYLSTAGVNLTDPALQGYYAVFLGKLIKYHTLLRKVTIGNRLPGTYNWSTAYVSQNAFPHKVIFVVNGTCPSGKGKHKPPCVTNTTAIDEQGNVITFGATNIRVRGGGYIQVVNQVLQPNDVFPSITAAVTSSGDFSVLLAVVNKIETEINVDAVSLLEATPGTLAAPANIAFASLPVDPLTLPANVLLSILQYHFCPAPFPARVLFTPFRNKKANPCTTLLPGAPPLTYVYVGGLLRPRQMSILYQTGPIANPVTGNATILVADITTPIQAIHVINQVLIPPTP